jgi:Flp pilus assembly protein TadG
MVHSTQTRSAKHRQFRADERGNMGMMLGLALFPILATTGAAIDYSRSSNLHTRLASIADASSLVGAKLLKRTFSEKKAAAEAEFNALAASAGLSGVALATFEAIDGGIKVNVSAKIKPMFMGVFGFGETAVAVTADARTSMGNVEVALVLDNTGSMLDDMPGLREAARSFTETVFANSTAGAVRMSLVPYTASVNVGRTALSMSQLDTGANSAHHAQGLRGRGIGYFEKCTLFNTFPPQPDPGGTGKKGVSLPNPFLDFADAARQLLGVSTARAQSAVTPNSDLSTAIIVNETIAPPYAPAPTSVGVPNGYTRAWEPCMLNNPNKISHFDLFNRIRSASWKGCVEARPDPFDVTDAPPTAGTPNSLFVPYFWPDEADNSPDWEVSANNYLPDGPSPNGWSKWEWERYANLFKYDGKATATISEVAPNTSGPNKSCGQALTPLTDDKSLLLSEISKMSYWNGGGTVSSEGLMWGWRTVSPNSPFVIKGASAETVKKYIVLMSDGDNSLGEQGKLGPMLSEYSAYGYLRGGRFPAETFAQMNKYLSDRMELACKNAKAAGITVVTVLFRVDDSATRKRMQDCASGSSNAHLASDATGLKKAFEAISGDISKLRLVK